MSEILVYAAISAISGLCSGIMTYVIAKHLIGTDQLLEKFDQIVSEIKDNPEMQQKIASVGMLIGVGIKQGVGLGKGTGKRDLTNTIVEGIFNMFTNKQNGQPQGEGANLFG